MLRQKDKAATTITPEKAVTVSEKRSKQPLRFAALHTWPLVFAALCHRATPKACANINTDMYERHACMDPANEVQRSFRFRMIDVQYYYI